MMEIAITEVLNGWIVKIYPNAGEIPNTLVYSKWSELVEASRGWVK